jgi:ubiquinone/menaquinone biosynthesis C-methylase UbiE
MKLDVGCGNAPTGDVNIDLPVSELHRGGVRLAANRVPNFVYASTYALPFRDNSFDEVLSVHLLEHLETPLKALKEMVRVSRNLVMVVVPALGHRDECKEHLYTWTDGSLFNILCKAGLNDVKIKTGFFREVKGNILKWLYQRSYVLGNFAMIFMRKFYHIELQGSGKKYSRENKEE